MTIWRSLSALILLGFGVAGAWAQSASGAPIESRSMWSGHRARDRVAGIFHPGRFVDYHRTDRRTFHRRPLGHNCAAYPGSQNAANDRTPQFSRMPGPCPKELDLFCERHDGGLAAFPATGSTRCTKQRWKNRAKLSGQMFRKVEYMNIIGNLGPLMGLLGTVYGMIIAFNSLGAGGGTAGTDAGGLGDWNQPGAGEYTARVGTSDHRVGILWLVPQSRRFADRFGNRAGTRVCSNISDRHRPGCREASC